MNPASDLDALIRQASRQLEQSATARACHEPTRARALAREALHLTEQACGSESPDVANVLNHLAGACEDQGDYAEAERLYRRSMNIMESFDLGDSAAHWDDEPHPSPRAL